MGAVIRLGDDLPDGRARFSVFDRAGSLQRVFHSFDEAETWALERIAARKL
jgi:hypothetical protein